MARGSQERASSPEICGDCRPGTTSADAATAIGGGRFDLLRFSRFLPDGHTKLALHLAGPRLPANRPKKGAPPIRRPSQPWPVLQAALRSGGDASGRPGKRYRRIITSRQQRLYERFQRKTRLQPRLFYAQYDPDTPPDFSYVNAVMSSNIASEPRRRRTAVWSVRFRRAEPVPFGLLKDLCLRPNRGSQASLAQAT